MVILEGQRKEKDRGKGQESQDTSRDEARTVVSNEIQHVASSFGTGNNEETLAKFPLRAEQPDVLIPPAAAVPTAAEQQY